jgi:hypothetical protein
VIGAPAPVVNQASRSAPKQDTGIQLDPVAWDLLGKSGRAMLDALVASTTDPGVLGDLASRPIRKSLGLCGRLAGGELLFVPQREGAISCRASRRG